MRSIFTQKMLTREEIVDIVQYHNEHGVTYKSRLKKIGISEWRFYESKRRYTEVEAGEWAAGEFLQLVRGNSCQEPMLTSRKTDRVRTRIRSDEHRDAHADRDSIANPGQSGRDDGTSNNPGVVKPCLARITALYRRLAVYQNRIRRAVKSRMDSRIFWGSNCGILRLLEEMFCSGLIAPGAPINFAAKR